MLLLDQQSLDRVFGDGYAAAHPDIVTAVVQSAASDWAASRLAAAIERVADVQVNATAPLHKVNAPRARGTRSGPVRGPSACKV